jgi:fucose permease
LIGALSYGVIQDKFGYKPTACVLLFEWIVAVTVFFWYLYTWKYSFGFAFSLALVWGLQDGALNGY